MKPIVLAAVGVATFAVAGCQTAGQKQNITFVRADGRPMRGNAKLEQQFQLDATICKGEMQKIAAGAAPIYYSGIVGAVNAEMIAQGKKNALLDVGKGCMAERGYVQISEEEAEARRLAQSQGAPRT